MKRLYPLLILVVLACVAPPKRSIENHIFNSSYPAIKIRIDPIFSYLGNNHTDRIDNHPTHGQISMTTSYDTYDFAILRQGIKQEIFNKALRISIKETNLRWTSSDFEYSSFLYKEKLTLNGMDVYLTIGLQDTSKLKNLPKQCMVISAYHIFGPTETTLLDIIYLEDVSISGTPPYAWKNKDALSEAQKSYLVDLKRRFLEYFQFI